MFGSIGWGVLMFIMGIVLDYSTFFPTAKCDMNDGERNYNVCFYMFSTMMGVALLVSTQIQFRLESPGVEKYFHPHTQLLRYSSPKQPDIPLGNVQNGGTKGTAVSQSNRHLDRVLLK